MRYNRLTDLGISQKEIEKNLLFTTEVGNTMSVAMRPEDAKNWLGTSPPDLSVEERARRDWLYSYLRSFYRDDTRPSGWNNAVFENVGMPHVLWQLQGQHRQIRRQDGRGDGREGSYARRLPAGHTGDTVRGGL